MKSLKHLQQYLDALPKSMAEQARSELQTLAHEHDMLQEDNQLLREANKRLRHSHSFFGDLYMNAPTPYLIFDETGQIESLNRAAASLLQISEDISNTPFAPFLAQESKDTFTNHLQQIYTHRRRYRCELKIISCVTSGKMREPIEVTLDSAWQEHPDATGGYCLSTCTDISNFKRLQDEIEEARQHAEKASSLKSQFLANMSHEIRTPLSSVLGYVDLLRQDIKAPEQREKLEIVYRAGKHLLFLLNEIIDLSRIEHGRFTLQNEPFLPSALFDGLYELFDIAAENKSITLTFARNYVPEPLLGDAERIRQIMVNIIGNAIKFTPPKGTVDVRVLYQHGYLVVDVRDSGPGIPRDQLDAIFEIFHQADESDTRRHGGSGLGLAISQKLAMMMNGVIKVDSEPGKGSTFTIRIPTAIADSDDDLDDISGVLPAPFSPEKTDRIPKVLIVDDDRVLQRLLGIFIKRMGYEFDIAIHGQDALMLLAEHHYDLVLLDLQMPVMDGYETVRHIRSLPSLKELPVLALTAKAIQEDLNQCIAAGCDSYITKPVVYKQLAHQVHRYLQPIDLESEKSQSRPDPPTA